MAINFIIVNRKSKIDGTGAFAQERISSRKKIGDLGGEVISLREARRRARLTRRVAVVEFGD